MAGLDITSLSASAERTDSPSRLLPTGPCSLRDAYGPCGCQQFWDKTSTELHHGSKGHIPASERSTSCVCGHHACFHAGPPVSKAQSLISAVHDRVHVQHASSVSFQSQLSLQAGNKQGVRSAQKRVLALDQSPGNNSLNPSSAEFDQPPDRPAVSRADGPELNDECRDPLSQASTSGLPPIPSICLLSQDRRVVTGGEIRGTHSVAGLGLDLSLTPNNKRNTTSHQSSSSPAFLDGQTLIEALEMPYSDEKLPSTRSNSMLSGYSQANSPRFSQLIQVKHLNQDQDLHLGTAGDTIRDTYRPEEIFQSVTEVATPSIANTPDLGAVDEAVQDLLPLLNSLFNPNSNQHGNGIDNPLPDAISAPLPQILLTHSSTFAREELLRLWRALLHEVRFAVSQEVKSYLRPLYNFIIAMPNVSSFQRDVADRLSILEAANNSFSVLQPDECRRQHSDSEDRTIALEHRVDELERLLQAMDADRSNSSVDRRHFGRDTESFHSTHSTASSALVPTLVTREEFELLQNEVRRKATSMPSPNHPWKVEVVLLPWGPELRGLWYRSDQPIHEHEDPAMEEDEDWTQTQTQTPARRRTSRDLQRVPDAVPSDAQRSSLTSMSYDDAESGWSSQAISEWAEGSVDEWLSPRAIGKGNGSKDQVIYERLKSRGFVQDVELRSSNARDINATLSKAFHDLLGHLRYTDKDEDPTIYTYPGLRASFIPLRKDFKNPRLRFLTPSEMASSALWNAGFLAAGVSNLLNL